MHPCCLGMWQVLWWFVATLLYWMESIGRSMSTPVLKTGRAVFIEIKTFENIAGKNPAGKMSMSIMLHFDNLSRSNSSIKRKRGWIWTVLYHFLVWWHWHITAHIQTFRFHQTNQIHYIDMIIDHSGHELFRMGNRGWWHFTIIYILRFGNLMLEIIIVCNHKMSYIFHSKFTFCHVFKVFCWPSSTITSRKTLSARNSVVEDGWRNTWKFTLNFGKERKEASINRTNHI